jgi:hypothetical protein
MREACQGGTQVEKSEVTIAKYKGLSIFHEIGRKSSWEEERPKVHL